MGVRETTNPIPIDPPEMFDRAGFFNLLRPLDATLRNTSKESLLLFASLDNYQQIVAASGIDAGNRALGEAARILARSFRKTDVVAQLSTNLFAVLAIGAGRHRAQRLMQRMHRNFDIANMNRTQQTQLVIRTGQAFYNPDFPISVHELLGEASRAILH